MLSAGQQMPVPTGMQPVPQRICDEGHDAVHAKLEQVRPLGQSALVQHASAAMQLDPHTR
jgi:hypothetical protein